MASSRPTTPVPDDCPVCMDPLRAGHARVDWCPRHPLCRECADRIRSGGDCRCPMCRQPWFLEERRAPRVHVVYPVSDSSFPVGQIRALSGGDTLTITHPDTWIPLPRCSHGNHGYCAFCATEHLPRCSHGNHGYCAFCAGDEESPWLPFDDMNWTPEGGYDTQQGAGLSDDEFNDYYQSDTDDDEEDHDTYVQQWNEENEEDVPMYVRAYDVSF